MSRDNGLIIEPLNVGHDRSDFSYGKTLLDLYLRRQAGQDVRRRIARVFVATEEANPAQIAGFYTLSALSIEASELPREVARRLPKHPIPAALLGRLAVAEAMQGRGIGKMLLMDAIQRSLSAGREIALFALVVDAKDEEAKGFYARYGFRSFPDSPLRMFLALLEP